MIVPQTPWYQNPVAISGYAAQVIGVLLILCQLVVTLGGSGALAGLPAWVLPLAGAILAAASKLGLDAHSATVRAAELSTAATTTAAHLMAPATTPAPPQPLSSPLPPVVPAPPAPYPPATPNP